MSWFGDSLNSLKGQITKITNDVLAEDENENGDPDSAKLNLKELEELCAAKDLEISHLREENAKISEGFQEELKMLRNENQKLKAECKKADEGNSFLNDGQVREICELENQLEQFHIERDHMEELEKDNQSNISLVAQQRDSYKQELDKLNGTHSTSDMKNKELLNLKDEQKGGNYMSDNYLTENQAKPDELNSLGEITGKLQAQVESSQNEKEEMGKTIEKHECNSEDFKEKTEKLMEDVRILREKKKTLNNENQKLKEMISFMSGVLNHKNEELKLEKKLRKVDAEKLKELNQNLKCVQMQLTDYQEYVDLEMRRLSDIFLCYSWFEKYPDISIGELVSEVQSLWDNTLAERQASDKMFSDSVTERKDDVASVNSSKDDLERQMRKKRQVEKEYREKINLLESQLAELKSKQESVNVSQTDDVKRLRQEVSKLKENVALKDKELTHCYTEIKEIGKELNCLRSISVRADHDNFRLSCERDSYERNVMELKVILDTKENMIEELVEKDNECKEKINCLEKKNISLEQANNSLRDKMIDLSYAVNRLKDEKSKLNEKVTSLLNSGQELKNTIERKSEPEKKICVEMQNTVSNLDNKEREDPREQFIIEESTVSEQDMEIQDVTRELNQSKEDILKLQAVEEEPKKCKEIMIDMEMQRQELLEESELIKNECVSQKSQVLNMRESSAEIERLTRENTDLKEVCNKLEMEIKNKTQNDALNVGNETINYGNPEIISSLQSENYSLKSYIEEQTNIIKNLTHENNEMKHKLELASENANKLTAEMVQLKQDECKINSQDTNSIPNTQGKKNSSQPHRRNNFDFSTGKDPDTSTLRVELEKCQEISKRQIDEYKKLQEQFNIIVDKEAHSKKELERLRLHLIEMENYYVETIDEYKAKLSETEEQLKNSSSFYTSNKVRDNQHLESLQSQIRLISAQRDSLQEQLSTAQDEIQKQKAALVSLHVVLQQFQQDKEKECESIAVKFQNQLEESDKRLAELQREREALNIQLIDAKNGLKAASRLGEQLEKNNEYVADLEGKIAKMEYDVKEFEEASKLVNQSNAEKVDKSLLKNLLLGYISSEKPDRKEQVLRIMMSVLDFDEEERNKTGMDNDQPGWLSSLLHPKTDSESSSQSLSEAFIRFLENESRPRPQLKLLAEETSDSDKSKSGRTSPKPTLLLEELVLPTFNSPQSSESSILKDVLNDP